MYPPDIFESATFSVRDLASIHSQPVNPANESATLDEITTEHKQRLNVTSFYFSLTVF